MIFTDTLKANSYLNGNYVICNGEVGFTQHDGDQLTFHNGKSKKKLAPIRNFVFKTPRLGYLWDADNQLCAYVERIPVRGWKVGVNNHNVTNDIFSPRRMASVVRMIEDNESNNFPHIRDALLISSRTRGKVPVSQYYAINYIDNSSYEVYFMNNRLGIVNNSTLAVPNESYYLHKKYLTYLLDVVIERLPVETEVDYENDDF